MSAFSELDRQIQQIIRVQAINAPIEQVIDDLWLIAQDVAMDDGKKYAAIRNAIAWLEVLRG
jgi:hypothetical protein